jgi:acetyl esterase/lipase
VKEHAAEIRGRTKVRLLVGDQDPLLANVKEYDALLTSLRIDHQFAVVAGAHHRYDEIVSRLPGDALQFWKTAFLP